MFYKLFRQFKGLNSSLLLEAEMEELNQELTDKKRFELLLEVLAEGLIYIMMAEKNEKPGADSVKGIESNRA